MTELLPSLQAERIRRGLVDYLTTTFALADLEPRRALAEFLEDPENGIFHGPYVRLRAPYRQADPGWENALDWTPPFPPYRHQAKAFRRLTTKDLGPDKPRPRPTIVTTGTGSGKTEAFLYPILDHVRRARLDGITGTKAIILYPMNALAADQADRLAGLITGGPELATITAALYTGDAADEQTKVTADGLITSRKVIREDPPDILLTNYKMLDQLLLRPADQSIWEKSALSLTYLVLDEFHTYDGAQGTDVAMLLRRLGLALEAYTPADRVDDLAEFDERPLGRVTPVATSATLGDSGDVSSILSFAHDVFGEKLDRDAAVTEQRVDIEEWSVAARRKVEDAGLRPLLMASFVSADLDDLVSTGDRHSDDADALTETVSRLLYRGDPGEGLTASELLRAHPDVRDLITRANEATSLARLAADLFPSAAVEGDADKARRALATILAAMSHVRALDADRDEVSVEITLWLREVSRVDRVASAEPGFRWSDDGDPTETAGGAPTPDLPAAYCRSCGRSGWMIQLAPTGRELANDESTVRRDHLRGAGRIRMLTHAPGEDLAAGETGDLTERLRWYHVERREILTRRPTDDDEARAAGLILPVLMHDHEDADAASRRDECPSCGRRDSIRFLGSAIATLLSVTLSTLFGDPDLDIREKRALVFTDSVQDAAHRAGFVSSRSHAMSLRAALRSVLEHPMTLEQWVDATLTAAADDAFARYRLVPADVLEHEAFQPYLRPRRARPSASATATMRRRLLLDASLEIGLQSGFGRTLESTGSIWAQVEAGDNDALLDIARTVLERGHIETLPGTGPSDASLVRWVRGALEHLRREGAIDHEWFEVYKREDGARYRIWGGRPRRQGMPAFPSGRSAPAFAVIGGGRRPEHDNLAPVASAQSWFARWTARNLGIPANLGGTLAVHLIRVLTEHEVLTSTSTSAGATVHGLPTDRIMVGAFDHDGAAERLVCDTCHTPLPCSPPVCDQLVDGPCLAVRCPGQLTRDAMERDSFYRTLYAASDMRRVDAQEHTSLLDPEDRKEIEKGFKRTVQDPGDPNVLVATPTLEMGIDIGDLSTVMLSSLPDSVAKYLQRVGRGGRLSGSSLTLAYVTGRGQDLPRLGDPTSLINGPVRPPATYLEAEEILRRQFIASVIDEIAREAPNLIPRRAGEALESAEPGTLLGETVRRVQQKGDRLVTRFSRTFPEANSVAQTRLAAWVTAADAASLESLAAMVFGASIEFRQEVEHLRHQRKAIRDEIPALKQRAEAPAAHSEDKAAYRSARSALGLIRRQLDDLETDQWISGLELRGLLPTYSLVDDSVRLDAQVSWIDAETGDYDYEPVVIDRSASRALHEMAPGAHFYARGLEIRVDGIDIADSSELRPWVMCPACGFVLDQAVDIDATVPGACPRCGSADISDTGQRILTARLTRVFSELRRDDARISDTRDDRRRVRFEVVPAVDFDPQRRTDEWSVADIGLGLAQYRRLPIRWVNFGEAHGAGPLIAGREVPAAGFRLCRLCGKLDQESGRQGRHEHRAWCPNRSATEEDTLTLGLTRTLVTEGTAVILPPAVTADSFGAVSLAAAMMLGLRETLGGAPNHLDIIQVPFPVPGGGPGEVRDALLLHDTVPGGTGYLADLGSSEWLWRLLVRAGHIVEQCPCQEEGRASCHRCLLPFARGSSAVNRVVAVQALRVLLGLEDQELIADLDPEVSRWSVVRRPITTGTGESPLEHKFRLALQEALESRATVREEPTSTGIRLRIMGLGDRVWTLTPQVLVHNTRPDYVLESSGAKPVAIYVDGAAYHAGVSVNRLRDDAEKRESLRANGYHVIAVTAQDLAGVGRPSWLAEETIAALLAQPAGEPGAGISRTVVDEQAGGPLSILEGYMTEPVSTPRTALADAAAFLLARTSRTYDGAEELDALVCALASGEPAPSPGAGHTLACVDSHMAVGSVLTEHGVERVSLVLHDSPDVVGSEEHRQGWRAWLRLANLLTFADVPCRIWTTSMATVDEAPAPGVLPDAFWPGFDASLASEAEQELAVSLTAAGADAPTEAFGELNGVPVSFSWPGVAVVTDLQHGDREAIGPDWTVIELSRDPARVTAEILSALASPKE